MKQEHSLNLKYFFIVAAIASLLISLDIIYQYIFGVNIIGFKSNGYNNAGFFGDEYIAGGYILRFSFFLIFFSILTFKNKKYASLISTIIVISILATGILLSGNRMPFVLFSFGLLLILLFNSKIKTILLLSFIPIIMIFKLIISTDDNYRQQYETYYHNAKNIVNFIPEFQTYLKPEEVKHSANLDKDYELVKSLAKKDSTDWKMIKWEASHRRIFLAALDTWKLHKIFGNCIKSFRITCPKLGGDEINLAEDLRADKKNRLCSTHPHNYYLEILTDTGIVGFIFVFLLALLFIIFIFKNMKFRYEINIKNLVLLSAIISLALELTPLRSSGSIFTSNNATYLAIIGSLVLGYKELLKTNIE